MALARTWRSLEAGEPFIGKTENEYTDIILESARAVAKVREDTGIHGEHFVNLNPP